MLLGEDGALRPTIFGEMSALAASTGAINLGQGFPDEDGPREVLDAAKRAIEDYGYTRVYWYPDGTDGWAFFDYPTEVIPREPEPG